MCVSGCCLLIVTFILVCYTSLLAFQLLFIICFDMYLNVILGFSYTISQGFFCKALCLAFQL